MGRNPERLNVFAWLSAFWGETEHIRAEVALQETTR